MSICMNIYGTDWWKSCIDMNPKQLMCFGIQNRNSNSKVRIFYFGFQKDKIEIFLIKIWNSRKLTLKWLNKFLV